VFVGLTKPTMNLRLNRTGSCERGVDYTVFPMPKVAENEYV
tara:strand:+ start:485 stop:607 length:123 start_codon:yes stop_codon:yes gene_type:complete